MRTKLITLSEMGNMPLPRQHASKHLLLLERETNSTITTVEHFFPNGTYTHQQLTNASHTRARRFVRVLSAFGAGASSHSSEKRGVVVLTPNNVTIVAPGATNLGVSPSVSKRGFAIA